MHGKLRMSRHAVSALIAAGALAALPLVLGATADAAPAGSSGAGTPPAQVCGFKNNPPQQYKHVIWVWMENQPYTNIIGSPTSPYVNSLAQQCGLATNYHNITHPSAPEYLAATSGELGGAGDCTPSQCPDSNDNIFNEADLHGVSWKTYSGGEASVQNDTSLAPQYRTPTCAQGDPGSGYNPPYDVNHNPPVYYTDINPQLLDPSAPPGPCQLDDVDAGTPLYGNFASDLASNRLPAFSFIGPDLCSDTHDCPIYNGDNYLQDLIGTIVSSNEYQSGQTVLFLVWDEGEGGTSTDCAFNTTDVGCHVAAVVVSPSTRPGTQSDVLFNHYSLLKTTEQLLNLPLLGHSADPDINSMIGAFNL